MIDVSVIIPFLNENENLADVILGLNEYADSQSFSIEAIFVDDGSTDSSVETIRKTPSNIVPVKLIRLSKNFGSHAAIRAGLTEATGKYAMFFMADLQEPFSMIGDLHTKALEGYDIVAARKASEKRPLSEKIFSGIYTCMIRKFAVPEYPKGGVNIFLFSKKVKDYLCQNIETNSSIHMQILNMGFRRAILDFSFSERKRGKSKWTFSKKVKLFIDSFLAFSYIPIRLITILGLLFFICGTLYALFVIIVSLTEIMDIDPGFPTFISVTMIGFGLTNLALGIIAEYLWRTLDAARGRPVFIIDTIEEIENNCN